MQPKTDILKINNLNLKKMKTTISVKDIISVLKNDNRFQGNQSQMQSINLAISNAKGDKSDLINFAKEVKSLLN